VTASELIEVLAACDPQAVIIPGNGSISHPRATFKTARVSRAFAKTKEPHGTKYLEMPDTGRIPVVVLE
jgi:hypothetical protein